MRRRKRRGSCTSPMPAGGGSSLVGKRSVAAVIEPVESRLMLAADVVISEFLAGNTRTLADRDGTYSDWIELYNRGDAFADLSGWHLTDDADELDRWTFPAGIGLAPGEYRIVFASDKPALPDNSEL